MGHILRRCSYSVKPGVSIEICTKTPCWLHIRQGEVITIRFFGHETGIERREARAVCFLHQQLHKAAHVIQRARAAAATRLERRLPTPPLSRLPLRGAVLVTPGGRATERGCLAACGGAWTRPRCAVRDCGEGAVSCGARRVLLVVQYLGPRFSVKTEF